MRDYIKREDAIEFGEFVDTMLARDGRHTFNAAKILDIKAYLNRIKAADVRENVHGEWIDTGSGEECSVCHEIQYGYDSGRRFCASCGAIMDGGDNNE